LITESEVSRFQASENLAMILKRQGKIERAIQIYEDLILKYPEKRGYFAAQIEKARTETGS
jgi:TolA-binding protein